MPTIKLLKKNSIIQQITPDQIIATGDHIVWSSKNFGKSWLRVCSLYPSKNTFYYLLRDFFLRSFPIRTIRKNIGINDLVILNSGTLIIQYDKIYRYTGTGKYAIPVFDIVKQGIYGPLKNGLAYDWRTDSIYFGEYIVKRPRSIRIFKGSNDGRDWDICYEFPLGRIRHIHGIFPDPYHPKRIWVCTGDNDEESGLFFTDDNFSTLSLCGGGSQEWRMVSLIITEKFLYWGSDAGAGVPADIKNYIYRFDKRTGKLEKLYLIDKPAYYGCKFLDGSMCLTTTFEPGIKRKVKPTAEIWWSQNGYSWKLIFSLQYKPSKRKTGTKFAVIIVPQTIPLKRKLLCSPVNVQRFDFSTLSISFN